MGYTDAEALAELRRLIPIINKGQAAIRRMRDEAGIKPGEPLLGLRLEERGTVSA